MLTRGVQAGRRRVGADVQRLCVDGLLLSCAYSGPRRVSAYRNPADQVDDGLLRYAVNLLYLAVLVELICIFCLTKELYFYTV